METKKKSLQEAKSNEENIDLTPFLKYLSSKSGHEIATRVVAIFEDLRKSALASSARHTVLETVLKLIIVLAVVVAASLLSYYDRLSPTISFLFGTLVGYLLTRKKQE